MTTDFSPAVQRAVRRAEELAQAQDLPEFGAIQLFIGLTEDDESQPAELLRKAGLNREPLTQSLHTLAHSRSASWQTILTRTRQFSVRHGADSTLTGDFLLIALLQADAELREALIALGLNWEKLQESVLGREEELIPLETLEKLGDPVDELAAGRILDVNANRVRESLRILDDFARFVLNDEFATREIKSLRHDFVTTMGLLPESSLLTGRETIRDVGTSIQVETEYFRESPRHLAKVNLKRLQESLRSLEEYSKLFSQLVPIRLEQLRYRTYTLEKMLSLGTESRDRLEGRWLYLLLSLSQCRGSLEWTIEEAVAGGVALIQLREKDATDREILERAKRVRKITRALGVPFILNDRPDLARLVEADGVHLGQDDLQVGEARKIVGREMMIGVSTHDLDQLRAAIRDGASYLGVGPTFPSSTKSFSDFAGLNFVAQASRETTLPWFAIGGINAETIDQAVGAGARRVAVSAAIAGSEDPRLAARVLREALEQSPG